jgi:hypothetical protein
MIIKILGILDIFMGICFWLFGIFNFVNSGLILILGLILLIKGIAFLTSLSIASILDIISAIIFIISSSVVMPHLVVILVSLFLLQKGAFSLLS